MNTISKKIMSLHAQTAPETKARLDAQRRTSTITSLIIALLTMVLIGVILLIIAMNTDQQNIPRFEAYLGTSESEDQLKMRKISPNITQKPTAPSRSTARIIQLPSSSPTSVPVPEIDIPDSIIGFPGDDGFSGNGWDEGNGGPGSPIGTIPSILKKRCSHADRMDRLLSNGGNAECEKSVIKSLRWLKETQNKDGSWTDQKQVGMTALALLAYLGHCETAQSEEFGETVLSAIIYLVDKAMKNNGKLATDLKDDHWCYEHAIATYALAEAYTLCTKSFGENINQLEEAVQASGQFLINSQHSGGGWDYGHYYAVQCMINNGGPEWERYNKLFRDQLLNNQAKNGSFKPLNKGNQKTIKAVAASFTGDTPFATHYRTCLATLMLESYYRFLPASQGK
jgi:hypothetical protein